MLLRLIPAIHRATHRIALHVDRLEEPRVTQAEAHVLAHLASVERATIGQVHRAFGHKRSTLTSILDRLERRRLVVRTPDARDRRTFVITLTRTGRTAARRVANHLRALEARIVGTASPADVRACLGLLARIHEDEE